MEVFSVLCSICFAFILYGGHDIRTYTLLNKLFFYDVVEGFSSELLLN